MCNEHFPKVCPLTYEVPPGCQSLQCILLTSGDRWPYPGGDWPLPGLAIENTAASTLVFPIGSRRLSWTSKLEGMGSSSFLSHSLHCVNPVWQWDWCHIPHGWDLWAKKLCLPWGCLCLMSSRRSHQRLFMLRTKSAFLSLIWLLP